MNDLRFAFRQLLKNPGFTAAAVLTLALGIGATTTIFSVVYAVLLRPLPYREPERLVQLYETGLRAGGSRDSRDWVSFPNFLDWRRENQVFEDVAAYRYWPFTVAGDGTPETVLGLQVTSGLFSVLGVHPSLGRTFVPEEDQPGKGNVAILSYGLWQRRFGGSQSIAGRPITIDGQSCTIVGVMPDGFQFPYGVPGEVALRGIDLWIPMRNPEVQYRSNRNYWAVARLKRGVTLERAQLNMDAIGAAIAQQYPNENRDLGVKVTSLQQHLTREVNQPLWILLGAIGMVLLIACDNLASLLLSKVNARLREMAVRAALGASRFRLVRQSLTEACLLSVAGAAVGLLLAVWAVESFRRLGPANIPRLQERYAEIYVPHLQVPSFASALVVRTRGNPMAMAGIISKEVASQDPTLALFNVHPMLELVATAQARRRFQAALLGAFAGLALVLAEVGIYGVIAYWMSQRVREIAIRMAVGARQIDVLWLIVRHGLVLTAGGLALGLAGTAAMSRFIGSLLFRTSAADLRIYAVVCLLLAGVALLACYFPARRAAKVDPMVALRAE